jgi:hypothetical protein
LLGNRPPISAECGRIYLYGRPNEEAEKSKVDPSPAAKMRLELGPGEIDWDVSICGGAARLWAKGMRRWGVSLAEAYGGATSSGEGAPSHLISFCFCLFDAEYATTAAINSPADMQAITITRRDPHFFMAAC